MSNCCSLCGSCCRVIALPFTRKGLYLKRSVYPDGVQVYEMLRRISRDYVRRREPNFNLEKLPPGFYLYRCVNIGPDNRCRIYDQRPAMCREFPYYSGETHKTLADGIRRACGFPVRRPTR